MIQPINKLISQFCNVVLATFAGVAISAGITFQEVETFATNPLDSDWKRAADALVMMTLDLQSKVSPYVEGPAADFAIGLKESVIENQDQILEATGSREFSDMLFNR